MSARVPSVVRAADIPTQPVPDVLPAAWLDSPAPPAPMARRRLVRRDHRSLALLSDLHASTRHPAVVAVDGLVLVAATFAADVMPWTAALGWAAVLLLTCYLTGVHADRDSVATQGILWYPLATIPPVVTVCFVGAATHLLPIDTAGWMGLYAVAFLFALRCLTWPLLVVLRRRGLALRRTLIVGMDQTALLAWRRMVEFPEAGLVPVQMVEAEMASRPAAVEREIVAHQVEHVILGGQRSAEARLAARLHTDGSRPVRFSVIPPMTELFLDPASVSTLGGIPLLPLGTPMRGRRSYAGKRALDVTIASLMLLLLSPVLLAAAVAILLEDGRPVFFKQRRVGQDGTPFEMVKLRSMVRDAEARLAELQRRNATDGLLFKMYGDPRITRVGHVIRRLSVDELPQLLNVLKGDMSLVGPRPLPVDPDAFEELDAERHTARPGITGYWQISGGPALGYAEMVRLDLAYLRNMSLWLDVRLLLRTVPALVHRRGPC